PRMLAHGTVGYVRFHGMWRSLVSAPALGAGGRRFESGHPDQVRAHIDLDAVNHGSQSGSHVLPCRAWLTARGAGTARTRSTLTMPPAAGTTSIIAAAQDGGAGRFPWVSAPTASGYDAKSAAGPGPKSKTSSSFSTMSCVRGFVRRRNTQS